MYFVGKSEHLWQSSYISYDFQMFIIDAKVNKKQRNLNPMVHEIDP
jgi:hypothetical protein